MLFHVFRQKFCLIGSKVTLVAFVGLFSIVCFQMFLQIAQLGWSTITCVAFVCLFSTVYFQICYQNVFIRGWIITLVAFAWFFSTLCFQMRFCVNWICDFVISFLLLEKGHWSQTNNEWSSCLKVRANLLSANHLVQIILLSLNSLMDLVEVLF